MSTRTRPRGYQKRLAEQAAHRRRRWLLLGAAVVALAALVAALVYVANRKDTPSADAGRSPTPTATGQRSGLPSGVSADGVGLRVGNGPVPVDIYLDFLCPICGQFEAEARDEIAQLVDAGKITAVYHPVAILDRASTNQYSTRSASGAACASDTGKLTAYVRTLFEHQPAEGGAGWTDGELIQLARSAGIGGTDFAQCISGGRYTSWIGTVTAAMAAKGIQGTPTVLVNGNTLEPRTGAALVAAVDDSSGNG